MHDSGHSKLLHWDNLRDGEGVGKGLQYGYTCTPMADSHQCMAKATIIL